MIFTIIIIVIAVGILTLVIVGLAKGKSVGWLQFYVKGKDRGFSVKEIELLYRLASKSKLDDPSALFWSQNQLDICIRSLVLNMHMNKGFNDEDHDFLAKLYDYRKKIELNKPKNKNGITSSRHISNGQHLRVLVSGIGVFKSEITKNASPFITISRPVAIKRHKPIAWKGTKISVYFWREDDAGYVFDTVVLDEIFFRGQNSLKINHSESLFRTQSRKSVRVKLHKPAFLYMLNSEDYASRPETNPGLKCYIQDLSENGCAVTIGGKASDGLRVKTQFMINREAIVMPGTVKSVNYKEELNQSVLHLEADPLPIDVRNKILGEVFGTLPDEEEELPFRITEEEWQNMGKVLDGQTLDKDEENDFKVDEL
jgi:c-di-GMP-binding flagellar brake protein YcgR